MNDLYRVGGVQKVMRVLLDAGLLHGDCLTVTGRTVAENLEEVSADLRRTGRDPSACDSRVSPKGPISILKGNLAEEGAVLKTVGIGEFVHKGPARVFESEEEALEAILDGRDQEGRHGGDPQRGAAGRTRHAGDARADLGARGRRSPARRRAGHRRPVLRAAAAACSWATSRPRPGTAG